MTAGGKPVDDVIRAFFGGQEAKSRTLWSEPPVLWWRKAPGVVEAVAWLSEDGEVRLRKGGGRAVRKYANMLVDPILARWFLQWEKSTHVPHRNESTAMECNKGVSR